MALPPPEIIDLAKAYAFRLEQGYTVARAQKYIRDRFPGASAYERRRAYYEAQRAMAVGGALELLGHEAPLSEALGGMRRPAPTVGVRVQITRYRQGGTGWQTDRINDLYIEMRWDETIQDVFYRAREWFESVERTSGPATAWEMHFVGPTMWPGASPGLEMEG